MASFSVPCPKPPAVASCGMRRPNPQQQAKVLSFPSSNHGPSAGSSVADRLTLAKVPGPYRNQLAVCKAQVNEVSVEKSLNNSAASPPTNLEIPSSDNKDTDKDAEPAAGNDIADASISAFMSEVASLVKIVDSRDIVELHLKQQDCELVIRKKEALPQPPVTVIQMPSPAPHTMLPQLPANAFMPPPAPASAPTPPPPAPATSAPALPAPAKSSSSSLPLIKCPMAGTFYRCPAPGEPPFVQVGDKVQKGKILCIVEAMKLMNEIEADQSGTIVEILAEDGKPVSIDTPLFIIQP